MHTRSTLIALVMLITSSKGLFLLGFFFLLVKRPLFVPILSAALLSEER
jgi:hypothetical protein